MGCKLGISTCCKPEGAMPVAFPVALNVHVTPLLSEVSHPRWRNVCDIFCISEINTTARDGTT